MKNLLRPFLIAALLAVPATALADVPPPDSCLTAGDACDNAPPDYQTAGTCTESTCTKATPDGSTEYPCLLCIAGSAGSGGSSGSGAGGSSGSGTGGSAGSSSGTGGSAGGSSDSDDGGCAIRGTATGAASLGIVALALGALAFGLRRRS